MSDDRIAAINQELADAFSRAASQAENVTFRSVTIGGDILTLDVHVDRRER